jgi:glycerophosphoryl diester phosphodiesterase
MKLAVLLLVAMEMVGAQKILVHGHRGARAARPENTIPAFEYALRVGVDVLELDLVVTKDNVLVVSHDPTMNAKFCRGPKDSPRVIREMTLEQLRQWDCGGVQNPEFPKQMTLAGTKVPTFVEVLELAKDTKVELNVETKISPEQPEYTPEPEVFARMVIEEVKRFGLESRVILQSFDWRTLDAAKKIAPEIRTSALYMSRQVGEKRDYIAEAKAAGYEIVSPHFSQTSKADVERAHQLGMQVVPWTANESVIWQALIQAGVDGIITDDPEALIEFLKEKNLR